MAALRRRLSGAACALALVAFSGCATTGETKYYLLTPLATADGPVESASGRGLAVGLRPVELPAQLDRPQIVTRVGGNTLHLAEFDQWAAPLGDNFTRVLAEDLALLVPTERVVVFPWSGEVPIDYQVRVDVTRFEGSLGGDCSLAADWTITKRDRKDSTIVGKSSHREPAGATYATMVAAQSRLVAALGRDIAAALGAASRQ